MSVQAGIWNFDGKPVDPRLLADFSTALKEQGPDGEYLYVDGPVALLYRAFHTTSESRRETQPHVTRRGFVLTWDGRLDNRDELGPEFHSQLGPNPTDATLVGAAFDRWESDCFRRIVGDWAASIWRPETQELILASDYMAIRHIFYYLTKDRVWWSTDLAPLVLLSGTRLHIDDEYVAGYFAHEPDVHLTPYREIHQVPAGRLVHIGKAKTSVERYWHFKSNSRIRYRTDAEYEEHFRLVFRTSVKRRLRSDAPVLAELSGGLDSSSIVCMADDILAKEGVGAPRLDTLSYFDKSEPQGDDWIYFPKIEEHRGRIGTHIDAGRLVSDPGLLEYSEFTPLPGFLSCGQQLETERAAVVQHGGYRAVLSGIGGDEFLGGIPNPSSHLADLIMQFKFITLAQDLFAWSLIKRRPWTHLLWQAFTDFVPPALGQYFVKEARVESWIEKHFARKTKLAIRLLDVDEHFGLWLPTRRSCVGRVLMMANKLAKLVSRTQALEECRYPYLDRDLIEFVLSIPANQLLRPGERRSLMRRSLAGLVPQAILSRRTKQFGARTPVVMLETNWDELYMAFDSPLSSHLGYVNCARFLEKLCAARNGKEIHIVRMLRTISLEFWLRDLASRHLIDGNDSAIDTAGTSLSRCPS